MKKQKLKLNAKLSFDKDIVSTLNKDGLSQIVGGMMPSTAQCSTPKAQLWVCYSEHNTGC